MKSTLHAGALIAALASYLALFDAPSPRQSAEFDEATLIFELNETDADAEVVLDVDAPGGLAALRLEYPDGKTVFSLKTKGQALDPVGLKQFAIESGEPDIASILAAFPAGTYRLIGETIMGLAVASELELSHALVPAPSYVPPDGAVVPTDGVVVQWTPMPGAASYTVEIEQDELGFNLTCTVPAFVDSLRVPDGFLLGDTEYELGVAVTAGNGNVSVAESTFTTLP
jgi:hypothetical protein